MIEGHKVPLAVPGAPVSKPAAPAAPKPVEGPSFGQVLEAIGRETKKGEQLVEHAVQAGSGRDLAPAELIALQAGVYRWVEVVDLASKMVDRATQAVKTVTQPSGG